MLIIHPKINEQIKALIPCKQVLVCVFLKSPLVDPIPESHVFILCPADLRTHKHISDMNSSKQPPLKSSPHVNSAGVPPARLQPSKLWKVKIAYFTLFARSREVELLQTHDRFEKFNQLKLMQAFNLKFIRKTAKILVIRAFCFTGK